jgi:hypothetical protein
MLDVFIWRIFMLSVVMLRVIFKSVIVLPWSFMLRVGFSPIIVNVMLTVVMISVVMVSVVAPLM